MQVIINDLSFGNYVNMTETYPNGTTTTTVGQVFGNRFNVTETTRAIDGEEIRESVTGMLYDDGSQYNVERIKISHYIPYSRRQSDQSRDHQSINHYGSTQPTQHRRSFRDDDNNFGGRYW